MPQNLPWILRGRSHGVSFSRRSLMEFHETLWNFVEFHGWSPPPWNSVEFRETPLYVHSMLDFHEIPWNYILFATWCTQPDEYYFVCITNIASSYSSTDNYLSRTSSRKTPSMVNSRFHFWKFSPVFPSGTKTLCKFRWFFRLIFRKEFNSIRVPFHSVLGNSTGPYIHGVPWDIPQSFRGLLKFYVKNVNKSGIPWNTMKFHIIRHTMYPPPKTKRCINNAANIYIWNKPFIHPWRTAPNGWLLCDLFDCPLPIPTPAYSNRTQYLFTTFLKKIYIFCRRKSPKIIVSVKLPKLFCLAHATTTTSTTYLYIYIHILYTYYTYIYYIIYIYGVS